MQLEWAKFYIAKVSFFEGNPIHEQIIHVIYDKKGEEIISIFDGHSVEEVLIRGLNYFEIIKQIEIKK